MSFADEYGLTLLLVGRRGAGKPPTRFARSHFSQTLRALIVCSNRRDNSRRGIVERQLSTIFVS